MPLIAGLVPLITHFFLELPVVFFDLLKPRLSIQFGVLTHLFRDESEKLTHLERYVEKFLIDKLSGVILRVTLLYVLKVVLQIPELVLSSVRTGRGARLRSSWLIEHSVYFGLNLCVNLFLNRIEELFAEELAILQLNLLCKY